MSYKIGSDSKHNAYNVYESHLLTSGLAIKLLLTVMHLEVFLLECLF